MIAKIMPLFNNLSTKNTARGPKLLTDYMFLDIVPIKIYNFNSIDVNVFMVDIRLPYEAVEAFLKRQK